jgi:hypothetical protein
MTKQNNFWMRIENLATSAASGRVNDPRLLNVRWVILHDKSLSFCRQQLGTVGYLISRITGAANAFSNVMDIEGPFRTLFTNAGLKHTMHVPILCRTLG